MELNVDDMDNLFREIEKSKSSSFPDEIGNREEIWEAIVRRRNEKQRERFLIGIAACLVLVMATYSVWKVSSHQSVPGDLVIEKPAVIPELKISHEENSAMEYIRRLCAAENPSCESPDFLELKTEMEDSFRQIEEINHQIAVFGEDPALLKAKIRAENHKAEVIKDMMLML